jgi:hypothetical protein
MRADDVFANRRFKRLHIPSDPVHDRRVWFHQGHRLARCRVGHSSAISQCTVDREIYPNLRLLGFTNLEVPLPDTAFDPHRG